ncbi:hypothetical protein K0U07_02810 [bacterium]|nr:hypothetical protein [bacterium]
MDPSSPAGRPDPHSGEFKGDPAASAGGSRVGRLGEHRVEPIESKAGDELPATRIGGGAAASAARAAEINISKDALLEMTNRLVDNSLFLGILQGGAGGLRGFVVEVHGVLGAVRRFKQENLSAREEREATSWAITNLIRSGARAAREKMSATQTRFQKIIENEETLEGALDDLYRIVVKRLQNAMIVIEYEAKHTGELPRADVHRALDVIREGLPILRAFPADAKTADVLQLERDCDIPDAEVIDES